MYDDVCGCWFLIAKRPQFFYIHCCSVRFSIRYIHLDFYFRWILTANFTVRFSCSRTFSQNKALSICQTTLKPFKIFFIHSKHNYNVQVYRCTCAERSQHFFDLNIRRRFFFFYWTQRVLSLFPPFVGVLVFCEQKATLMTIHKMQKWYRWFFL